MTRYILANFDCETEYAGTGGQPLPSHVKALVDSMAARLSLLGGEHCQVVSGDAVNSLALNADDSFLAWAETESVTALRNSLPQNTSEEFSTNAEEGYSEHFKERLWATIGDAKAAKAANDKRWAAEFREAKGWSLPGSCQIKTIEDLRQQIQPFKPPAKWVVKAPFGTAGRERVRRIGSLLSTDIATRIERLLTRHKTLLFEPWVDRIIDFGTVGLITPSETLFLPTHKQIVDATGVCRAIETHWQGGREAQLDQANRQIADALRRSGYIGPFGIDGFAYRDERGRKRILPLSEINARLTFGHVAYAKAERTGSSTVFELAAG